MEQESRAVDAPDVPVQPGTVLIVNRITGMASK
jgi:hypothetical protein